jgi:protein TonB
MAAGTQPLAIPEWRFGQHIDATPVPRLVTVGATEKDMALPASPSTGFGARRLNRPAIAVICAMHLLLVLALIKLDVIHVDRPARDPVVMQLLEIPPLAPPAAAEPELPQPVEPQIVAPTPVVAPPVAAPVRVATTVTPPPVLAAPLAAPAAAQPGPPAPITPPDFSADYLNNPAPRYPIESRRQREEGTVEIMVSVNEAGEVETLRVFRSSGHQRLDKAALSAVKRWRFTPAKQAGMPVAARVIVPIPFQLQA